MQPISTIRILFMGTPDFAVPSLRLLHEQSAQAGWQIVGVATQPDRPAGRGQRMMASSVKQYAVAHGLPVLQPASLRKDPAAVASIAALQPDLIVVAAYGLILPRAVLELPTFGCVNVHASLLPAYRGASPITAALLDGLTETGVSIMLMDVGMDTGPVLRQARTAIAADATAATLSAQLAEQGAALLVEVLPDWLRGEIAPIPQEELPGAVSLCRLVAKADGRIDWQQPAAQIERMTRAYMPWPAAYTTWRGEVFKILRAAVLPGQAEPGRVVATAHGPAVGAGDGLLLLVEVQPAGKRAMDGRSFLNGAPEFVGARLPEE
jgi:methionyl-tRNA formyltransferase